MEVIGFGVSNLELKCFFKNNGGNLSNNFVGVSPADDKKEFIKEIQHNDKAKYPFLVVNTDLHKRPVYTGGHFWMQTKQKIYFSLTRLGHTDYINLL